MEEENAPAKKAPYEIGQPLDLLSVDDIDDAIALLAGEIERLKAAGKAKASHLQAANALFKR